MGWRRRRSRRSALTRAAGRSPGPSKKRSPGRPPPAGAAPADAAGIGAGSGGGRVVGAPRARGARAAQRRTHRRVTPASAAPAPPRAPPHPPRRRRPRAIAAASKGPPTPPPRPFGVIWPPGIAPRWRTASTSAPRSEVRRGASLRAGSRAWRARHRARGAPRCVRRRDPRAQGGARLAGPPQEEGGREEGDRGDDGGQGRLHALPRGREQHADRGPGAQEAGLPVPHQLRQDAARPGDHGCEHLRQGAAGAGRPGAAARRGARSGARRGARAAGRCGAQRGAA
jgi:hypothetical protein